MNKHGNLIWSCVLLFYIVICFLGALLLINDGVSDVDAFLFFFMYFGFLVFLVIFFTRIDIIDTELISYEKINDDLIVKYKDYKIEIIKDTKKGKFIIPRYDMDNKKIDKGKIIVDDLPYDDITRLSLRKNYGMVLQDTWLFKGTIFENIAYGKENATMDEVVAAAKAAHIHSYISRLPQGYDTVLTQGGQNLSQGQRQLLNIARAAIDDLIGNLHAVDLLEGSHEFVYRNRTTCSDIEDLIAFLHPAVYHS